MGWTEEQQAAIAAQHQRVLVAAAAGSGKTAVLVARIIRMLREEVCNIDELLVLTFTRAAAAEMRACRKPWRRPIQSGNGTICSGS